jgi:hypothetical protein
MRLQILDKVSTYNFALGIASFRQSNVLYLAWDYSKCASTVQWTWYTKCLLIYSTQIQGLVIQKMCICYRSRTVQLLHPCRYSGKLVILPQKARSQGLYLLSVTQQGEYAEYYTLSCEVTERDIFILASNGIMQCRKVASSWCAMCGKRVEGVGSKIGGQWQLVLHELKAWVESKTTVRLLSALHILQPINNISDYNTPVFPNPMLLQPKPFILLKKTVNHTKNFLYIL